MNSMVKKINTFIFYFASALFFQICLLLAHSFIVQAATEIRFSNASGFYDSDFTLTLEADEGTIYYTLDGSEPNTNSILYDEVNGISISDATNNANNYSLRNDTSAGYKEEWVSKSGYVLPDYSVDKCTVVRASVLLDDGSFSNVYTHTYFVGFENRDSINNINVLSLVADPDDLFGYENGIYVLGKAYDDNPIYTSLSYSHWHWANGNFRKKGSDWERKASMEFFDTNGNLILSQVGGVRIHGGGSRGFAQKSLNLYARKEIDGNKNFKYNFFGTGYKAKKLTLSSGGDDIKSKGSDYLVNTACMGDSNYAIAHMIPYALFLNGEYWGMYYLSEKYDDKYIANYYDVDDDNVIMVKNGEIEEGEDEDIELWKQMKTYIANNNMEVPENYQQACDLIDIDSYVHYYATEIYIGRWNDWPASNTAAWRCRETGDGQYEDGKWRWMIFDLNSGAMGNSEDPNPDSVSWVVNHDAAFKSLMYNAEFRQKLYDALVEVGTTYMSAGQMDTLIDGYLTNYLAALEASHDRYFGTTADSGITERVTGYKNFFDDRYDVIIGYMNAYLTRPEELLIDTITHVNRNEADCTHEGNIEYWRNERTKKLYSDSSCTVEIQTPVIPITNHTPGEAVKENLTESTCAEMGYYDFCEYCEVCGALLNSKHEELPLSDHLWGEGKIAKEATYSETGEIIYECQICGEEKTEEIPLLESVAMYRLYNPNSGEHFYTGHEHEKKSLEKAGWTYEGIAWKAPSWSEMPVYRLYNPNSGDHHYTTSEREKNKLVKLGWGDEGIGWYSADEDGVKIFRLYNPNAETGSHHYTLDGHEKNVLERAGWSYEGIGWYALK